MVNKIVQLVDKDNNNVFPVAGSLKQGSVTTSTINDKAVTADKLGLSYSTSEQTTGETWIDGSAIYKKTINFGSLPDATTKNVAHGISNLSKVIRMEGYAKKSSGVFQMIPYVPTHSAYLTNTKVDSTNIITQSVGDLSGYTECYITLYYTKSS